MAYERGSFLPVQTDAEKKLVKLSNDRRETQSVLDRHLARFRAARVEQQTTPLGPEPLSSLPGGRDPSQIGQGPQPARQVNVGPLGDELARQAQERGRPPIQAAPPRIHIYPEDVQDPGGFQRDMLAQGAYEDPQQSVQFSNEIDVMGALASALEPLGRVSERIGAETYGAFARAFDPNLQYPSSEPDDPALEQYRALPLPVRLAAEAAPFVFGGPLASATGAQSALRTGATGLRLAGEGSRVLGPAERLGAGALDVAAAGLQPAVLAEAVPGAVLGTAVRSVGKGVERGLRATAKPAHAASEFTINNVADTVDALSARLAELDAAIEVSAAGVGRIVRPSWAKMAPFTKISNDTLRAIAKHEGLDPAKADWGDSIDMVVVREIATEGGVRSKTKSIIQLRAERKLVKADLDEANKRLDDLLVEPITAEPPTQAGAVQSGMGIGEPPSQGQLISRVGGGPQPGPLISAEQVLERQRIRAERARGQTTLPETVTPRASSEGIGQRAAGEASEELLEEAAQEGSPAVPGRRARGSAAAPGASVEQPKAAPPTTPPRGRVEPPSPEPSMEAVDRNLDLAGTQVRQNRVHVPGKLADIVPGVKQVRRFLAPGTGYAENVRTAWVGKSMSEADLGSAMFPSRLALLTRIEAVFGQGTTRGGRVAGATFVGTPEQAASPITNTLLDIAQNPDLYRLTPTMEAVLREIEQRNLDFLEAVRDGYGAEIGRFVPKEGGVHLPNIDISDDVVERLGSEYLTELESNPDRVRGLAGWDWIEDAIQRLPARFAA